MRFCFSCSHGSELQAVRILAVVFGKWDLCTSPNVWTMFDLAFVRSCKGNCGARDVGELFRGYI